jgi:membrane protease YdiL (CAAX protease family)
LILPIFILLGATAFLDFVGGPLAAWPFLFLIPALLVMMTQPLLINWLASNSPSSSADSYADRIRLCKGHFDGPIAVTCTALGLLSVGALFLWHHYFDPVLAAKLPTAGSSKLHWIVMTGILFATVNAVVEELYFREVLLSSLRTVLGKRRKRGFASDADAEVAHILSATTAANLIQALLFGWMHWSNQSVPHGASGFVLTTVFGLLLGAARIVFQGLAAPIWIHILADLGVYSLLVNQP